MALTCNIEAKGKVARLIYGLLLVVGAIVLALKWAWPAGRWQPWAVVGAILAFGAFGIFEAWVGWCVVRAMGYKTKF